MNKPLIIVGTTPDLSKATMVVYEKRLLACSTGDLTIALSDLRFAAGVVTNILRDRAPLSQRPRAALPRAKGPSARAGASAKRRGPGPSLSR